MTSASEDLESPTRLGATLQTLSSLLRLTTGLAVMAVSALLTGALMLLALPSRIVRIKIGNLFGKTVSRLMVWLSGCTVTVRGAEHLDASRAAIYVSNHTSIMDIFIASWLSPMGTVGVAKKEVAYYPFFGQLYLLSGHLRIDRGNSEAARTSLAQLGKTVRDKQLSIFLWPEGTRSRDGHLLPFKKGLVYLAVQTGLPVVPMVVKGAQKSWQKHSIRLARVPIEVEVLPPIDTSGWDLDHVDEQLSAVRDTFCAVLPPEQLPGDAGAGAPRRAARG